MDITGSIRPGTSRTATTRIGDPTAGIALPTGLAIDLSMVVDKTATPAMAANGMVV